MPYLQYNDAQFRLAKGETRVGRGAGADLRVPPGEEPGDAADVSLVSITIDEAGYATLRVVEGGAGVFVNAIPVGRDAAPLLHGDRVVIDGCELRFGDELQTGMTGEIPSPGDVRVATPSAGVGDARSRGRLVSLTDGREYAVPIRGLTLGRDAECDVVVAAAGVSRHHAHIAPVPGGYELTDTSTNGVFVNGGRVRGALALARGDTVRIGGDEFRFYADPEPPVPPQSLIEAPSLQATSAIPAVKRPAAGSGGPSATRSSRGGVATTPRSSPGSMPVFADPQSRELARDAETREAPPARPGAPWWVWVALVALGAVFLYLVLQGR